nr:MAG TPA: hypothetical protein [Caudoviricetes sp.]
MKRSEKSRKASRVDANKAKQADFDRAIRERIRTAPAYMYTSLCPDLGRRRPPMRAQLARLRIWYKQVILGGDSDGG